MSDKAKPIRILTAVAPYDGHDVSILALNSFLLDGEHPLEVIYQGYNIKAKNIVAAAIQEDVDAIAVSSYNGGHLQFFPLLAEMLKEKGADNILIFGGGGATITPEDESQIEGQGVRKIYGTTFTLPEIVSDVEKNVLEERATQDPYKDLENIISRADGREPQAVARLISLAEDRTRGFLLSEDQQKAYNQVLSSSDTSDSKLVVVTGDGGSGKSTLIDELVKRYLEDFPEKTLAILSNDPTTATEKTYSAFLGDRVRMNNVYDERVFMRSIATGEPYLSLSKALPDAVDILRSVGYDLIIVETPGTGQVGINVEKFDPDLVVYVKTKEYGTGLQLKKDQQLHDADFVVLNKVDIPGSRASFDEIKTVLKKNGKQDALHATLAKLAHDPGTDILYVDMMGSLGLESVLQIPTETVWEHINRISIVPHARRNYLAEIAKAVREYDAWVDGQLKLARKGELNSLDSYCKDLLERWPEIWEDLSAQAAEKLNTKTEVKTINGLTVPKVALPDPEDKAESLRFLLEEGLPGMFPFVTGIYPLRLEKGGETTRQFAGLRGPEETNERLQYLAEGVERPRLSIAYDGITLYGDDPDTDPSAEGKIGEGGVSVSTWEDMKTILHGFDIRDISTSMTINGPAPIILAMFFNAAIDLEYDRMETEIGRELNEEERDDLKTTTLKSIRGTIQADILKEVQGQNECIFQPEFAIKLQGDMQEYFIEQGIDKFYSMSVSGYHIGEAGATPVQELADTLSNGLTYVENFLGRGMAVNDFAPVLSFFLRVSHEAEWLAYGAVCRKIWSIAMRDVYQANEKSQKFRFHTQTSGRSLQAEEWDTLNPLRQTYQAFLALLNNTNSLHVDSADEPMTTPGEKYVRQATMIPNYLKEETEAFVIQNLLSGSYAFRHLMKEVQEGILQEFERIDQLGGVIQAMDLNYQRRQIAESSQKYESDRHKGDPRRKIIGYNTYELPDDDPHKYPKVPEIIRPNEKDWKRQIIRIRDFRTRHEDEVQEYLARLKHVALEDDNVFEELMETVKYCTLGEITETLAQVGGRFRKVV